MNPGNKVLLAGILVIVWSAVVISASAAALEGMLWWMGLTFTVPNPWW